MRDGERTLSVLFWNLWLLHPRLWGTGPQLPFPAIAPDVPERATAIGRALAGRFDVCAFGECFEAIDRDQVLAGWAGRPISVAQGPGRHLVRAGSGLVTVVDGPRLVRRDALHYARHGDLWRDSDALARKGALFVEVAPGPGLPGVEVVSTHLFAGGDLLPTPGHDNRARHHEIRMGQVDELVAFAERNHQPGNVLLVCGDLNVDRVDESDPAGPGARFADLSARLGRIGLRDAGGFAGSDRGQTSGLAGGLTDIPPADPAEPDRAAIGTGEASFESIDHVFVKTDDVDDPVQVGPLRRWIFPRDLGAGPARLSDHLAVSVDLTLTSA